MPNTKTGTTWAPDIRPGAIEAFTETYTPDGGTEQTLTYKRVADHPFLNGIRDIKAFFTTHVGAVWYNLAERKTLLAKLDEMDTEIKSLINKTANIQFTNLKTVFQSCAAGANAVYTTANSSDLPAVTTEWKYCTGLVLKRDSSVGNVVFFGYLSDKIAINSTSNGGETWKGWVIK